MASLIKSDLEFVLQQILIAEAHAGGADLITLLPHTFAPFGLRTVDGRYNNLLPGQTGYGASDEAFPRMAGPVYRDDEDGDTFDFNGPMPGGAVNNTHYGVTGHVADADPRIISNLIVDMTSNNPAAVSAFVDAGLGTLDEFGVLRDLDGIVIPTGTLLTIPNVAPDEGLSAPFNSWFTFFGQFFDHGLDLVNKSSTEAVFIPLQPDDPLYVTGGNANFMVLTRATRDGDGEQTNQTTPFVDQNQTYTSHPSHQVFLREYVLDLSGKPVATGRLLDGADGGLANWARGQGAGVEPARHRTRRSRRVRPAAVGHRPVRQVHTRPGDRPAADRLEAGRRRWAAGSGQQRPRVGHAGVADRRQHRRAQRTQLPARHRPQRQPAECPDRGTAHGRRRWRHRQCAGRGLLRQRVARPALHHRRRPRQREHRADRGAPRVPLRAQPAGRGDQGHGAGIGRPAFIAQWLLPGSNQLDGVQALEWNGERIFQAARFATEMQYQHLVFEEFARKMQPSIDEFLADTNYDTSINPAIVAEFAHAVFRFGHSMLTETVDSARSRLRAGRPDADRGLPQPAGVRRPAGRPRRRQPAPSCAA